MSITKRERFTLFAVRRVFDISKGSPFLEDVRSVLTNLAQRMSDKERAEHATFGDRFVYLAELLLRTEQLNDAIALASLLFARWDVENRSREIEMLPGLDLNRR